MSVPVALAIGSAVASVAGGFMQASATAKAAAAQAEANNAQLQQVYAENNRQQEEVNRIATEQSSDRVRQANKELGTLRAVEGEMGLASLTPFVVEASYNEGLDLSRIDGNRQAEIERLQAASRSGQLRTAASNEQLAATASTARTGALFNVVTSGLQLTGDLDDAGFFD